MTGSPNTVAFDLDAEAVVLSACVLHPEALDEALLILKPDGSDFYSHANVLIFRALTALVESSKKIDLVSIADWLRSHAPNESDRDYLSSIGGSQYLVQVVDNSPAVANAEQHIRRIRSLARQRRAEETFSLLAAEARAGHDDVDAWLEQAEGRVYSVTSGDDRVQIAVDYKELLSTAMEETRRAEQTGGSPGAPIGLRCLDRHLIGWQPGWLVFIAGRPGSGKTAAVQQFIEHSASVPDPYYWLYLSLEMTRRELKLRSVSRYAEIPITALESGVLTGHQWSKFATAVKDLSPLPIEIDDSCSLTPARVRSKVRRAFAQARRKWPKARLGGLVVDHIQLTDADETKGKSRNDRLGEVSSTLKQIAKEYECTVLALSQLSRPPKGSKPSMPQLSDLRDSGCLENDADVVIAIHRPDEYVQPGGTKTGEAFLGVLKGRSRGSDVHRVKFEGRTTRFYEEGTQDEFGDQYGTNELPPLHGGDENLYDDLP